MEGLCVNEDLRIRRHYKKLFEGNVVGFLTPFFQTSLELQKLVSKPANYSDPNIAQMDGHTKSHN